MALKRSIRPRRRGRQGSATRSPREAASGPSTSSALSTAREPPHQRTSPTSLPTHSVPCRLHARELKAGRIGALLRRCAADQATRDHRPMKALARRRTRTQRAPAEGARTLRERRHKAGPRVATGRGAQNSSTSLVLSAASSNTPRPTVVSGSSAPGLRPRDLADRPVGALEGGGRRVGRAHFSEADADH